MHKAMWLWKASHHNLHAQQVREVNTKDLATAKPSRERDRLKRSSAVTCTDHNHRLYNSSLAPLLEKSSFWISEGSYGIARRLCLGDRGGCREGRVGFHRNDRSQGAKEQHRSDPRAHPPAAGMGQVA